MKRKYSKFAMSFGIILRNIFMTRSVKVRPVVGCFIILSLFFVAPGGTMQMFGGFSSGGAKSPAGLLFNDRSG